MLNINLTPFPEISTKRLRLRKVTPADVDVIFVLRSDERIIEFIDRDPAKDLEDAKKAITMVTDLQERNEGINWLMTLRETGKAIGTIGLWQFEKENHRAEVGYVLHPDFWGAGYMSEAMNEVLRFAFHDLNLHNVQAYISPENIRSARVLERNGFRKEAHFRDFTFFQGRYTDAAVYTILQSDFRH